MLGVSAVSGTKCFICNNSLNSHNNLYELASLKNVHVTALTSVAQLIGCRPTKRKVAGLIHSHKA